MRCIIPDTLREVAVENSWSALLSRLAREHAFWPGKAVGKKHGSGMWGLSVALPKTTKESLEVTLQMGHGQWWQQICFISVGKNIWSQSITTVAFGKWIGCPAQTL